MAENPKGPAGPKYSPNRPPPPTHPQLAMLDAAVRQRFSLSWGKARTYIEHGKVTLQGEICTNPTRFVRETDTVELHMANKRPRPERDLDDNVWVYKDGHIVVLDKPSGISTIPFDENETGTLHDRVQYALSRGRVGERSQPVPLGIVHRIDKETSGLLVMTRTWLAKQSLTTQFREHTTHRVYLALVHGHVRTQTFESHLIEDRGDGLRGSYEQRPRKGPKEGQLAITHVELIEKLKDSSLIKCRLETGRTHQIRIHLSESGHPLIGERVYIRGYRGPELPAPRLMLHAAELGFVHPATDEQVHFERNPPKDMEEVLTWLRA